MNMPIVLKFLEKYVNSVKPPGNTERNLQRIFIAKPEVEGPFLYPLVGHVAEYDWFNKGCVVQYDWF